VLFLTRAGHPGPPWVRVAAVSALPAGTVTEVPGPAGRVVVVDRRDGLRAFLAAPGPCPVRPAGAARAAPPPLRRVPASLAGGALYVNPR